MTLSIVGSELNGDKGSSLIAGFSDETLGKSLCSSAKPVVLVIPENGDDSVETCSTPCVSEGSGRDEVGVTRMDLEDGSEVPSSN